MFFFGISGDRRIFTDEIFSRKILIFGNLKKSDKNWINFIKLKKFDKDLKNLIKNDQNFQNAKFLKQKKSFYLWWYMQFFLCIYPSFHKKIHFLENLVHRALRYSLLRSSVPKGLIYVLPKCSFIRNFLVSLIFCQ